MHMGRLVFNDQKGCYGIKDSNTDVWVNDCLNSGDNITLYDYNVDHWISEYIISIPPGNTPQSWYLKFSRFQGTKLRYLSVLLDEADAE